MRSRILSPGRPSALGGPSGASALRRASRNARWRTGSWSARWMNGHAAYAPPRRPASDLASPPDLGMMRAAGTAPAAHGTWLPGSREAPQCGAAGAGASHEVIRFGYERARSPWAARALAGRLYLPGSRGGLPVLSVLSRP